jgi:polyhydroxyalkanoate synthase
MTLQNLKLNLKKVRVPIYELATKEDHIAPAASVFKGAHLFGGDVTFVLAGSGHIAGVINPPAKPKYQYWKRNGPLAETLEDWMETAEEQSGSWWPHWAEWLARRSGGWIDARLPGKNLGIIEDAPGSYVKCKV